MPATRRRAAAAAAQGGGKEAPPATVLGRRQRASFCSAKEEEEAAAESGQRSTSSSRKRAAFLPHGEGDDALLPPMLHGGLVRAVPPFPGERDAAAWIQPEQGEHAEHDAEDEEAAALDSLVGVAQGLASSLSGALLPGVAGHVTEQLEEHGPPGEDEQGQEEEEEEEMNELEDDTFLADPAILAPTATTTTKTPAPITPATTHATTSTQPPLESIPELQEVAQFAGTGGTPPTPTMDAAGIISQHLSPDRASTGSGRDAPGPLPTPTLNTAELQTEAYRLDPATHYHDHHHAHEGEHAPLDAQALHAALAAQVHAGTQHMLSLNAALEQQQQHPHQHHQQQGQHPLFHPEAGQPSTKERLLELLYPHIPVEAIDILFDAGYDSLDAIRTLNCDPADPANDFVQCELYTKRQIKPGHRKLIMSFISSSLLQELQAQGHAHEQGAQAVPQALYDAHAHPQAYAADALASYMNATGEHLHMDLGGAVAVAQSEANARMLAEAMSSTSTLLASTGADPAAGYGEDAHPAHSAEMVEAAATLMESGGGGAGVGARGSSSKPKPKHKSHPRPSLPASPEQLSLVRDSLLDHLARSKITRHLVRDRDYRLDLGPAKTGVGVEGVFTCLICHAHPVAVTLRNGIRQPQLSNVGTHIRTVKHQNAVRRLELLAGGGQEEEVADPTVPQEGELSVPASLLGTSSPPAEMGAAVVHGGTSALHPLAHGEGDVYDPHPHDHGDHDHHDEQPQHMDHGGAETMAALIQQLHQANAQRAAMEQHDPSSSSSSEIPDLGHGATMQLPSAAEQAHLHEQAQLHELAQGLHEAEQQRIQAAMERQQQELHDLHRLHAQAVEAERESHLRPPAQERTYPEQQPLDELPELDAAVSRAARPAATSQQQLEQQQHQLLELQQQQRQRQAELSLEEALESTQPQGTGQEGSVLLLDGGGLGGFEGELNESELAMIQQHFEASSRRGP